MEEVNGIPMSTKEHRPEKLSTDYAGIQSSDAKPATSETEQEDEKQYPSLSKVIPVMAAVYLSLFLIALVSLTDNIPSKAAESHQNFRIEPSSPLRFRELLTSFTP
jgi:hypothetical protein